VRRSISSIRATSRGQCEGNQGSDPRLPCALNVPIDREVAAARWRHPPKRRFTRTATYAKVGSGPLNLFP
jgi:hypothetical protein